VGRNQEDLVPKVKKLIPKSYNSSPIRLQKVIDSKGKRIDA